MSAQSGFPFTPLVGSNSSGTGETQNPDVPNLNPAFSGPAILGTPNQWFDPRAFLMPAAGTFGNVARGSFVGPKMTNFDMSLFKRFNITERYNLQFRAEAFNILNHPNFANPYGGQNGFGLNDPSAGGFGCGCATPDIAAANPAVGSGGPRSVQLGLKLSF